MSFDGNDNEQWLNEMASSSLPISDKNAYWSSNRYIFVFICELKCYQYIHMFVVGSIIIEKDEEENKLENILLINSICPLLSDMLREKKGRMRNWSESRVTMNKLVQRWNPQSNKYTISSNSVHRMWPWHNNSNFVCVHKYRLRNGSIVCAHVVGIYVCDCVWYGPRIRISIVTIIFIVRADPVQIDWIAFNSIRWL